VHEAVAPYAKSADVAARTTVNSAAETLTVDAPPMVLPVGQAVGAMLYVGRGVGMAVGRGVGAFEMVGFAE